MRNALSSALESDLGTWAQLRSALTDTMDITRTRAHPTVTTVLAGSPAAYSLAPARGIAAAIGVAPDTGDVLDGADTVATVITAVMATTAAAGT